MRGWAERKLPTFPCFAAVTSTLHAGSNVLRLPGSGLITSAGARSARLVHLWVVVWRRMETFGRGQSQTGGLRSGFGTCKRSLRCGSGRFEDTDRLGGTKCGIGAGPNLLRCGISWCWLDSGLTMRRGLSPDSPRVIAKGSTA